MSSSNEKYGLHKLSQNVVTLLTILVSVIFLADRFVFDGEPTGRYVEFLVDASYEMTVEVDEGRTKWDMAREGVRTIIGTEIDKTDYLAVRTYGGDCEDSSGNTRLLHAFSQNTKKKALGSLGRAELKGFSTLVPGLLALTRDFGEIEFSESASRRIVAVIGSAPYCTSHYERIISARLGEKYEFDLAIVAIDLDPEEKRRLEEFALAPFVRSVIYVNTQAELVEALVAVISEEDVGGREQSHPADYANAEIPTSSGSQQVFDSRKIDARESGAYDEDHNPVLSRRAEDAVSYEQTDCTERDSACPADAQLYAVGESSQSVSERNMRAEGTGSSATVPEVRLSLFSREMGNFEVLGSEKCQSIVWSNDWVTFGVDQLDFACNGVFKVDYQIQLIATTIRILELTKNRMSFQVMRNREGHAGNYWGETIFTGPITPRIWRAVRNAEMEITSVTSALLRTDELKIYLSQLSSSNTRRDSRSESSISRIGFGKKQLLSAENLKNFFGGAEGSPISIVFSSEGKHDGQNYSSYTVKCSSGKTAELTAWDERRIWCVGDKHSGFCNVSQNAAAEAAC